MRVRCVQVQSELSICLMWLVSLENFVPMMPNNFLKLYYLLQVTLLRAVSRLLSVGLTVV